MKKSEKQKNRIRFITIVCLIMITIGIYFKQSEFLNTGAMLKEKPIVVIDSGHGGSDPGKVGINQALEKDINLSIALKLGKNLEKENCVVYYTRETDKGLYQASDSNKKRADLQNRKNYINEIKPDVVISIHQNSFPQEKVKGAQVFYYTHSEESKQLAHILQNCLRENIDPSNKRVEKANDSYFLLKDCSYPMAIVECGFLSNYEEANLLVTKEYQEKMAKEISKGVMEYIKESTKKASYKIEA